MTEGKKGGRVESKKVSTRRERGGLPPCRIRKEETKCNLLIYMRSRNG
jgi:hypothetical protein